MNTAGPSDDSLARAAAAGDVAAFETLVERHQHQLYREALGYLGSHDEALDAVQEALVAALKRFHQLREPVKVGPWLRTAVRNRCLNMLRDRTRRTDAHARYAQDLHDGGRPEGDPPGPAVRLLDRLPAETAAAFLLHYLDGHPLEAVARELGSTPAGVKQRLYRARHHLREEALAMARELGDALPDDFAARVVAHLLKSGRDDRLHMRYEAARAHFQEILDLQPGHSTALLEWGRTYGPMESPGDDQVGALERAARAAPESLEVLAELELASRRPGLEERSRELREKVIALADRRLATHEADQEALYCKARLLRGAGNFAQALALLQALVERSPGDQAFLYEYGLCLSRLDRHGEAVPVYGKVLRGDRTTLWAFCAHRQLATHHAYRSGEMKEAIRHMEAAWRLMPTPGEAGNLIYFHSGAGRPDRGLELYEENREHLRQPRIHAVAGMGYLLAGKPEEAEAAFHQALEGVSDDDFAAEIHLHLARLAHEADRPRQVDRHLRRGLSLDLGSRGQLAGPPGSPFRRRWTRWLAESLQAVGVERDGVKGLLTAVKRELDSELPPYSPTSAASSRHHS